MRRQTADARQAFAQVLAVEEFHGDVGGTLANAVVEDLDDVRASKVRSGLGLALEAGLHLGNLSPLPFDEFDGTGHVQTEVRRVPYQAHPPAPEQSVEAESLGDDYVLRRLDRHDTATLL